jgi:hypothetical protein
MAGIAAGRRAGFASPQISELALRMDQLEKRLSRMAPASQPGTTSPSANNSAPASAGVLDTKTFTELYEFSSRQPIRPYSLRRLRLVDNETDLRNYAVFLSREVPTRLAHAAAELAHAPFGFGQMEAMKRLRQLNEQSYVEVSRIDISARDVSDEQLVKLCRELHRVHRRHHITADLVAQAIKEFVVRNHLDEESTPSALDELAPAKMYEDYAEFQTYLSRVFTNRSHLRFLIGHFIEATRQLLPKPALAELTPAVGIDFEDSSAAPRFVGLEKSDFVGAICLRTNMAKIARVAVDKAVEIMQDQADVEVPKVDLVVHGDPNCTQVYPPKQAYNIITSLVAHALKQDMRQRSNMMISSKSKPVQVLVSQAPEQRDVVVRIRDFGGGIPYGELDYANTFLHSGRTTQSLAQKSGSDLGDAMRGWMKSALRLPVATVNARVFGGDLTIASVDGDSTTVCFTAPTKGSDTLLF